MLLIAAWLTSDDFDPTKGSVATYAGQKMRWQSASIARRGFSHPGTVYLDGNPDQPIEVEAKADRPEGLSEDEWVVVWRAVEKLRGSTKRHVTMYLHGFSIDDLAAEEGIGVPRATRSVREGLAKLSKIIAKKESVTDELR